MKQPVQKNRNILMFLQENSNSWTVIHHFCHKFHLQERFFMTKLKGVTERNNIIKRHQIGFSCNHSTMDQVDIITGKIEKIYDEKKMC